MKIFGFEFKGEEEFVIIAGLFGFFGLITMGIIKILDLFK